MALARNPDIPLRVPTTCEAGNCSAPASTLIGFVHKPCGSCAMTCDKHFAELAEQYRKMGSPGQIVLMPADSEAAHKFWFEVNGD